MLTKSTQQLPNVSTQVCLGIIHAGAGVSLERKCGYELVLPAGTLPYLNQLIMKK